MLKDLERDFREPGAWHRGMPFWAWNGKLSPDELRRQIRLMKRMGLGGFFMHSRVGLDTPYLSDEWFACIDACVDEAAKQGMLAWLYDEDRWPSGAAGGLVTQDPRWRRRSLAMREFASPKELKWDDDDGGGLHGTRRRAPRRATCGASPGASGPSASPRARRSSPSSSKSTPRRRGTTAPPTSTRSTPRR